MKPKFYILATILLLASSNGYAQTSPVIRLGAPDSLILNRKAPDQRFAANQIQLPNRGIMNASLTEAFDETTNKPEKTDDSYFLLQSTPNLQTGKAKLEVTISKTGKSNIYLVNYRGDKIKTIYAGQLSSGTNVLPFDSANLSDGLYYIITDLNGQQYADKFLIERSK